MKNFLTKVIIEIPKGTSNKYELNEKTGRIHLDRVLYGANFYPGEYGFIEKTLDLDGDPLDVIALSTFPTIPGCVAEVRIFGTINMIDDGDVDTKLIGVIDQDPRFNHIQSIKDFPPHNLKEIIDFFKNYKNLQKKKVEIHGFDGIEKAMQELKECQDRYSKYKDKINNISKEDLIKLFKNNK